MNNHIEKLLGQALDQAVPETWTTLSHEQITKLSQVFAELIVQECIDKITTYDLVPGHSAKWEDIYDIHTRLLQDLGEELKEHFGVEE